ncbi:hypothetical protein [Microbispora triticiradicis]|uniref:Helix-turn-helix transcriptional regulator n=2 Tax=Microbispora TaxID=2005 RepID=A0ABY3LTM9_9ACTN|nr:MULTISPECIES: hypothetical protein [Microbispora]TLP60966.1 hypothetical protein FED44_14125 [Microbispora fusca]TYB53036.1 hypothetical protein FXF59_23900 [Microbispora tritici]
MEAADQEPDLAVLLTALARFRRRITLDGQPSDRTLAKAAGVSPTTVGAWLRGARFPQQIDPLIRIVDAVREHARRTTHAWAGEPAGLWDKRCWRDAHIAEARRRAGETSRAVRAADARTVLESGRPGTPLDQVTDPFVLEVHRPITVDGATVGVLPSYVRRVHDERLGQVVDRVLGGTSAMAVLVAGSSAGKTRACWEALGPLRAAGGWRLWHPFDPTRREAALQELDRVGPRTVLWLNETQEYVGEGGERVAAKLRALLTDRARAPVLVLGTLWRKHHADLTRSSGSQVAQLLDDVVIEVPEEFTGAALEAMRRAAQADARLAEAVEHAVDGKINQYLAGGPELLKRLETAEPAAKAVIWAAMDLRRLGHGTTIPLALLKTAAPAYLTDTEWDAAGEDWLEQALAYTAEPCKGARGPLTRVRPGRGRGPAATVVDPDGEPVYRLADYLDQHGRVTRADQIPPVGLWTAAAAHAHPTDLGVLGDAAWARGLYREGAQLHKQAVSRGNVPAAGALVRRLHELDPTDRRPARWAVAHACLDDPFHVGNLLDSLHRAGAHDQIAMLLARYPVSGVSLDRPADLGALLDGLHKVGAHEQFTALAERAAAHAPLDPLGVGVLLDSLRKAGAHDQIAALLARDPAAHIPLGTHYSALSLLRLLPSLRRAGAHDQFTALAQRAAAHTALDDAPLSVGRLLMDSLHAAEAHAQIAAVLARHPASHLPLDNRHSALTVARLLNSLHEVGAHTQIAALLAHDPAGRVPLDDTADLRALLDSLRKAGAHEQFTALAQRAAAHAPLDDPNAVGLLLMTLDVAEARSHVATLLARDPAGRVLLDDPCGVGALLVGLYFSKARDQIAALLARDPAANTTLNPGVPDEPRLLMFGLSLVRAHDQITALAERLLAAGLFEAFMQIDGHKERFRFGREPDGSAADRWGWEDLE